MSAQQPRSPARPPPPALWSPTLAVGPPRGDKGSAPNKGMGVASADWARAAFLACVFLTAAAAAADRQPERRLLQDIKNTPVVINATNVDSIGVVLGGLQNGTTVSLDIDTVELRDVLTVEADRITIVGASNNGRTAIKCGAPTAGIELRGNNIVLQNVVVRECTKTAVDIVNPEVGQSLFHDEGISTVNVTIRNAAFNDNWNAASFGGGVAVHAGVNLTVDNCTFDNNSALTGGAIWATSSNLTVTNTRFLSNVGHIKGGGIHILNEDVVRHPTMLHVSNCEFVGNNDTRGGEEFDFEPESLGGEPGRYPFPVPQESGGGILVKGVSQVVIRNNDFLSNIAVPGGGAVFLVNGMDVEMVRNTFVGNEARELEGDSIHVAQGGAVFAASAMDTTYSFTNNEFRNNRAAYGGGLCLIANSQAQVDLDGNVFEDNVGWWGGGAMTLRNVNDVGITRTVARGNKAQVGGAFLVANGAVLEATLIEKSGPRNLFEDNHAFYGGALFFLTAGSALLQSCDFNNNRAKRDGGAVAAVDSLPNGNLDFQGCTFFANIAQRGGAIYTNGGAGLLIRPSGLRKPTTFINNLALVGGAICTRAENGLQNVVKVVSAQFLGNKASTNPNDVGHERVVIPVREFRAEPKQMGMGRGNEEGLNELANGEPCTMGSGGAVCVSLAQVPETAEVSVDFFEVVFKGNQANVGGAAFLAPDNSSVWSAPRSCSEGQLAAKPLIAEHCRELGFDKCAFENNTAMSAGGAVFATYPGNVWMELEVDFKQMSAYSLDDLPKGNFVGEGGYGANFASRAHDLNITSAVTPGGFIVENHLAGRNLPPITMDVADAFGQLITAGIADSETRVTASVPCFIDFDCVSGQRIAAAVRGVVRFDAIVVNGPNATYTLQLSADSVNRIVERPLSIRPCRPGEVSLNVSVVDYSSGRQVTGLACENCSAGQFSVFPSSPCRPCDINAACPGGAASFPKDGYWHSGPFSVQFHECIIREACAYEGGQEGGREERLGGFFTSLTEEDVVGGPVSNDAYPQCAKGYRGVLCGSCDSGFGHFANGECRKCNGGGKTVGLLVFVLFWSLLFVAWELFWAKWEPSDIADKEESESAANGLRTPLGGASGSSLRSETPEVELVAVSNVVQMAAPAPPPLPPVADGPTQGDAHRLRECAENVVETLKIAFNFLQVTSSGVVIRVRWNSAVEQLLRAWDVVVAFSNASTIVSIDCLWPTNSRSAVVSILALFLRIVFPIVPLLAILLLARRLLDGDKQHGRLCQGWLPSATTITLVVFFFSYHSVTEELLRTLNCVRVDVGETEDVQGRFSVATDRYWAEDTELKCFEKSRWWLVGLLGVPGLLLFTAAVPLGLVAFLTMRWRRNKGEFAPDIRKEYGFFFQNYKLVDTPSGPSTGPSSRCAQCATVVGSSADEGASEARADAKQQSKGSPASVWRAYWELVITLRKVAIALVVVFAYRLGGSLQAAVALLVVFAALVLHLAAQPYRDDCFNRLEAASLAVSVVTFHSGLVFNDANASEGGKVTLAAVVCLLQVALMAAFAACAVCYLRPWWSRWRVPRNWGLLRRWGRSSS
ncbi:unnamed protein product [Ostreobium quekettii]|uniref:Right handed beta helix domain-containing protein n=1 Tax=Ostreobium quekettii TaxID=121088 RepID=A0A8S1IUZ2_9CHLO|nr:unnamed protein product [Ostreobium quekettii]